MRKTAQVGLAFLLIVGSGCADRSPPYTAPTDKPVTGRDVDEKVGKAAEAARKLAKQKKEEFQAELREKIDNLERDIARMRENAAPLEGEAKEKWHAAREKLDVELQKAREKLKDLGAASAEAWNDFKPGAQAAWEDLKAAVDAAAENFR